MIYYIAAQLLFELIFEQKCAVPGEFQFMHLKE